jgi:hypothetical protein
MSFNSIDHTLSYTQEMLIRNRMPIGDGQTIQRPQEKKGKTRIYKTLHIKLQVEPHEPH